MKRGMLCALLVCVLLFSLCGCNTNAYSRPELDAPREAISDIMQGEPTEAISDPEEGEPTEAEPVFLGEYTLEESKSTGGLFTLCEDGSFNRYKAGGLCIGLEDPAASDGMYLADEITENLPIVDADTTMVLFRSGDYRIKLYLVNTEASVIKLTSASGKTGYGSSYFGNLEIIYRDYSRTVEEIITINGLPKEEYDGIEEVRISYNSAKGMPSATYSSVLWSFPKGELLKIGTADGTTLVETEYEVNATYYDFDTGHNHFDVEDVFTVPTTPTAEGYAKLDFSEVPAGKYVLMVDSEGTYSATLITIQQ